MVIKFASGMLFLLSERQEEWVIYWVWRSPVVEIAQHSFEIVFEFLEFGLRGLRLFWDAIVDYLSNDRVSSQLGLCVATQISVWTRKENTISNLYLPLKNRRRIRNRNGNSS
jgi:hypothetical protein